MKRLLLLGICLALMTVFSAPGVSARHRKGPHCEDVWVEGYYNKEGKWIEPYWKHRHWVPGHHNRKGKWIPARCM